MNFIVSVLFLSATSLIIAGISAPVTSLVSENTSKILYEGVCGFRLLLKKIHLNNQKTLQDSLDIIHDKVSLAMELMQLKKSFDELASGGYNTPDVYASSVMIDVTLKDICQFIDEALSTDGSPHTVNCSSVQNMMRFVAQISLLKSIETSCGIMKDYIKLYPGHINKNYCNWLFCTFNPNCNPGINATSEFFNYIIDKSPGYCLGEFSSNKCSCSLYNN
jgi:hypothetical protein